MTPEIRHRRLHAFFKSKVLNALMIVVIVSLILTDYTHLMVLPAISGALALVLFIGYSLWLWVKKPRRITINNRLSDINGWFTLYFLVFAAFKTQNQWFYIIPVAFAVVVLFLSLTDKRDEEFDI